MAMAAGGGSVTVAVGPVYINNDQDIEALAWKVAKQIQSRMR
jgi:hypothetical protein